MRNEQVVPFIACQVSILIVYIIVEKWAAHYLLKADAKNTRRISRLCKFGFEATDLWH